MQRSLRKTRHDPARGDTPMGRKTEKRCRLIYIDAGRVGDDRPGVTDVWPYPAVPTRNKTSDLPVIVEPKTLEPACPTGTKPV